MLHLTQPLLNSIILPNDSDSRVPREIIIAQLHKDKVCHEINEHSTLNKLRNVK